MKRAGGDEQDVIRPHHAITSVDGRAFNDWQNVALHAFARNVGSVPGFAAGNLIDFIEEDNPGGLDALQRRARHGVHID